MTEKSPKTTRIEGDVNVKDGDVVAGDKTVIHNGGDSRDPGVNSGDNNTKQIKKRDLKGTLDVTGGDVVFGDKIIKFFQDNLNIYLFKDIKQLAFFLAVVLVVAAGIAAIIWYSKQPGVMTGDFNIAIAQFGEIQANGTTKPSSHSEEIASTLFNYMDSEYQASGLGLKVQVAHKNMPLVSGNAQAEALAKRVHADIVIYGNVFSQGDQAQLTPRFYVAEQADTQELTGQNELAYPIPFSISELDYQNKVNAELRTRTEILLNFTKGLIYLSQKDPDSALRSAQAAIASAEKLTAPFPGEEVIYLLASKIYIARQDDDSATQMLDQALELNSQYARAYLGRGNIFYSQADQASKQGEDISLVAGLIDKALSEYSTAYNLPDQPEGAYIPIKASVGLGNVSLVKAEIKNDPNLYSQAVAYYTYVIDEYQQTKDPSLRSFAFLSYRGIGIAFGRQKQIDQAVQAYQKAYDAADNENDKADIQKRIKAVQAGG